MNLFNLGAIELRIKKDGETLAKTILTELPYEALKTLFAVIKIAVMSKKVGRIEAIKLIRHLFTGERVSYGQIDLCSSKTLLDDLLAEDHMFASFMPRPIHADILEKMELEVGQLVLVTHQVPDNYLGWEGTWYNRMSNMIGITFLVEWIDRDAGIVQINGEFFPAIVLQKKHFASC